MKRFFRKEIRVRIDDALVHLADLREQVAAEVLRPIGRKPDLEYREHWCSGYPADWIDKARELKPHLDEDGVGLVEAAETHAQLVWEMMVAAGLHKWVVRVRPRRGFKMSLFTPGDREDAVQESALLLRTAALYVPRELPRPQHGKRQSSLIYYCCMRAARELGMIVAQSSSAVRAPQRDVRGGRYQGGGITMDGCDKAERYVSEHCQYVPDVADLMDVYLIYGATIEAWRQRV